MAKGMCHIPVVGRMEKDENGEWFLNKEKSEWADIPVTVIAEFLIQQFGYDAIFNGGKQND